MKALELCFGTTTHYVWLFGHSIEQHEDFQVALNLVPRPARQPEGEQ